MNDTEDQVKTLNRDWARAEREGDVATLDALSTDDFTLVGPLGFVLDKDQWLQRYRTGGLVTQELAWDEISVRDYGGTAIVVGRHTQRAEFQGNPADGSFRGTQIAVHRDGRWVLAGLHLSPIGGPAPFSSGEKEGGER
jgi:ketosteroid isomerase-like protein